MGDTAVSDDGSDEDAVRPAAEGADTDGGKLQHPQPWPAYLIIDSKLLYYS